MNKILNGIHCLKTSGTYMYCASGSSDSSMSIVEIGIVIGVVTVLIRGVYLSCINMVKVGFKKSLNRPGLL